MKNFKTLFFSMAVAILFFQCGSDDDPAPSQFPGVPTGTIVPAAERAEVLTGDANSGGRMSQAVVWWQNDEAKVSLCDNSVSEDITQTGVEISFGTDGTLYGRSVGTTSEFTAGSWSWASSAKDAIVVQGVEFTFTELNENAVTYASKQEAQGQCVITYERYVK